MRNKKENIKDKIDKIENNDFLDVLEAMLNEYEKRSSK